RLVPFTCADGTLPLTVITLWLPVVIPGNGVLAPCRITSALLVPTASTNIASISAGAEPRICDMSLTPIDVCPARLRNAQCAVYSRARPTSNDRTRAYIGSGAHHTMRPHGLLAEISASIPYAVAVYVGVTEVCT